jgi:hypothetical protein
MNGERIISNILSTSCTPAHDLLEEVEEGRISYAEAWTSFVKRLKKPMASNLYSFAQAERDFMKRHDI